MAKVKLDDFTVRVETKWTCPNCQHKNEDHCNMSPYSPIAEDGMYSNCKICKEGYDLNFYDDNDEDEDDF